MLVNVIMWVVFLFFFSLLVRFSSNLTPNVLVDALSTILSAESLSSSLASGLDRASSYEIGMELI